MYTYYMALAHIRPNDS